MKASSIVLAALVTLGASLTAQADSIYIGQPSFGGSGCPQGTVSATLATDAKSLSILYDAYTLDAGGATGKRIDRKSCNVAIPVHVPQGYSFSVFQFDYRGFNSLPTGAMSQFGVEYFFAGGRGPRYSKTWRGSVTDNFLVQNAVGAEAVVWSPCGADVILRTNSNMFVQTNSRGEEAIASLDSTDVNAEMLYQFQWRRCQ